MWQIITGVNFDQLDSWIESIAENDDQICLPLEPPTKSTVEGLAVTDFHTVAKELSKLKKNKISSSIVMMYMTEQIRNQYFQRKTQEFDQLLLLMVMGKIVEDDSLIFHNFRNIKSACNLK